MISIPIHVKKERKQLFDKKRTYLSKSSEPPSSASCASVFLLFCGTMVFFLSSSPRSLREDEDDSESPQAAILNESEKEEGVDDALGVIGEVDFAEDEAPQSSVSPALLLLVPLAALLGVGFSEAIDLMLLPPSLP